MLRGYPEFMAEMYAYAIAAAHERLPHTAMKHFMVSNPTMHDEAWALVDALDDHVCDPPLRGVFYPDRPMPTFVHYCQIYATGDFDFYKALMPENFFSCESPLLEDTPANLSLSLYRVFKNVNI